MTDNTPRQDSIWCSQLVREITAVLLLKIFLLVAIYNIWFSESRPQTEQSIEQHLIPPGLLSPAAQSGDQVDSSR